MHSNEHEAAIEDNSEPVSEWRDFAIEAVRLFATTLFLAFLVWAIRWPFYGDDFYAFMQASLLVVSILFGAVGAWMLIFFALCRFPILAILLVALCIFTSLLGNDGHLAESCLENRYFSTCD